MDQNTIAIIGAPMDLGRRTAAASTWDRRRCASPDLNERICSRLATRSRTWATSWSSRPESSPVGPQNARYLAQIAATCAAPRRAGGEGRWSRARSRSCWAAITRSRSARSPACRALSRKRQQKLGRDLGGCARRYEHAARPRPSGNVHGMPLACCIGQGPKELTQIYGFAPKVDPKNVVLVGIARRGSHWSAPYVGKPASMRSRCATSTSAGMRAVMREAIADRDRRHCRVSTSRSIWTRWIRDEAPGVGTPVRGGITYREAHLAMEMMCDSRQHDLDGNCGSQSGAG